MSLDPSAVQYAQRMLAKGYGYQNACRIAGVSEDDLRCMPGAPKARPSPAPWRPPVDTRRKAVPYVPAQAPALASEETRSIMRRVAERYGLTLADLTGDRRTRYFAYARQEAMWHVRRERPNLSLPSIGRIFGGRDHTTVIHGLRCHEARLAWAEFLILAADAHQPDLFAVAA